MEIYLDNGQQTNEVRWPKGKATDEEDNEDDDENDNENDNEDCRPEADNSEFRIQN